VIVDDGAGLRLLLETIADTVSRAGAAGSDLAGPAAALDESAARVAAVTARLWSTRDPSVALANSTAYLEAVGHVVVAWMWLEQWLAVGDRADDFAEGKRQAARYFFAHELPRTAPQLDLLASLDTTARDTADAWF